MGLEIAYSVRAGRVDTDMKARGDILCVKLEGAPWGSEEHKSLAIVRVTDKMLKQMPDSDNKKALLGFQEKLEAQKAAGELYSIIIMPFAEYVDKVVDGVTTKEFVCRSNQRADLTTLLPSVKDAWLDKNVAVPVQTINSAKLESLLGSRIIKITPIEEPMGKKGL